MGAIRYFSRCLPNLPGTPARARNDRPEMFSLQDSTGAKTVPARAGRRCLALFAERRTDSRDFRRCAMPDPCGNCRPTFHATLGQPEAPYPGDSTECPHPIDGLPFPMPPPNVAHPHRTLRGRGSVRKCAGPRLSCESFRQPDRGRFPLHTDLGWLQPRPDDHGHSRSRREPPDRTDATFQMSPASCRAAPA